MAATTQITINLDVTVTANAPPTSLASRSCTPPSLEPFFVGNRDIAYGGLGNDFHPRRRGARRPLSRRRCRRRSVPYCLRFAERHPDRVLGLALIDGGLPVPNPDGVDPVDLPAVLLGPALERLSMTFPSRAAYVDFWRRHPALGPYWNDAIEAYVAYDVVGEEPVLRSSASADAVAVNAVELDGSAGYADALLAAPGPVDLFRAPRGLLDAAPLYPEAVVAEWVERMPQLVVHDVADVNHYTIVMSEPGAGSVIPVIRARIEAAETQEGAS